MYQDKDKDNTWLFRLMPKTPELGADSLSNTDAPISAFFTTWERKLLSAHNSLQQKQFQRALDLIKGCLEDIQTLLEDAAGPKVTCYLLQGLSQQGLTKHRDANTSFQAALKLCTRDPALDPVLDHARIELLGHLVNTCAEIRDTAAAIRWSEQRLSLLESITPSSEINAEMLTAFKIETLKNLSALYCQMGAPGDAEKVAYALLALQPAGSEKAKTLLLLARAFLSQGEQKWALSLVRQSQSHIGGAPSEPNQCELLAGALMLEGQILLIQNDLDAARECYVKAHKTWLKIPSQFEFQRQFCACNVAFVDTRRGYLAEARRLFGEHLDKAARSIPSGYNEPCLRPFLLTDAKIEHLLFCRIKKGMSAIKTDKFGHDEIDSINKALRDADCAEIIEYVRRLYKTHPSTQKLLDAMEKRASGHYKRALTRYTQVVNSLEELPELHPDIVSVYQDLGLLYRGAGNLKLSDHYTRRARAFRRELGEQID